MFCQSLTLTEKLPMTPFKPISARPTQTVLGLIVLALVIIVGYSLYAAFPFLEGPSLKVTSSTVAGEPTSIRGVTKRVSFLEVNGEAVPLGEDGTFRAERTYPTGYTALTVTARDRFGRTVTKTLSFLVEKNSNNAHATSTYGTEKAL